MAFIRSASMTVIGLFLMCTLFETNSQPVDENMDKALEAVTEGSNKFAVALYQQIKEPNKNLIVSPLSVQIVLALAYAGAGGNTAKEIADTLHLPNDLQKVLDGHKKLIEDLQHPVLKVANRMFVEKTLDVKPTFQKNALDYFQSDAGLVDFLTNHEAARQEINKWVESQTNDKIKELLAKDAIDSMTRLILINAVHFKADWAIQFPKHATHKMDFHLDANNKVQVDMMSNTDTFPYKFSRELDAQILELPYKDKNFKMVIILPSKVDGLLEVENKLSTIDVNHLFDGTPQKVSVKLPKFKLESQLDLVETLQKMGINDVFDEGKADLSGISDARLYANKVIQKAFIEVNEEGTEAAAATGIEIMLESLIPTIVADVNFIVDRKSLALIVEDKSLIFIARIAKPEISA